jgi:hypothetical protein
MKTYGGMEVQLHAFFILASDGDDQLASHPDHFTLGTHSIGDWMGPTNGLDMVVRKNHSPFQEGLSNV